MPKNADVWYNALPSLIRLPSAAELGLTTTTKQEFYDKSKLFQCPSAEFPKNPWSSINTLFSIAMNSKLISGGNTTIRVDTIKKQSQTVFFLENRLKGEPKVDLAQVDDSDPNSNLGQPSSFANRFAARHGAMGNLTFVDGHSAAYKGPQVVQTHPGPDRGKAILPQIDIVWTADPDDNPN